jgi:GDP-4-dehydro-6-deoxy-D-mannose reductase
MRSFVTGASGFVGSHLLEHLREHGDEVIGPGDGVGDAEIDITDRSAITVAIVDARPEVVYHLAAQADVADSWDDPVETLRVNVEGTLNVLDAARLAGASRVLAVTSADIYGRVSEADLPLAESAPLRPVSPYAASKAAADMLCLQATLGHGLDVIRVRAFNHLGPGQSDKFVASGLASRIVANERSGADVVRVGNLDARRDFTDVRDVVRAYRLLMTMGAAGEVYNVCSGVDRTVQALADKLVAQAESAMRLVTDPELLRPVDVEVLRGDPSKIQRATGWKPEIPIDTTIHDLLEFWRSVPPRDVGGQP